MTPTQINTIIISLIGFEVFFAYLVFWWMSKNRVLYQVSIWENGSLHQNSKRGRIKNIKGITYFIGMYDFFRRKKEILFGDWKEKIIATESVPIIGPKLKLKGYDDGYTITYWSFPEKLPAELVNEESIINFCMDTIKIAYTRFRHKLTDWELIHQVVIKGGILVLALACLIFFPKIYHTIADAGIQTYQAATSKLEGAIQQFVPKG